MTELGTKSQRPCSGFMGPDWDEKAEAGRSKGLSGSRSPEGVSSFPHPSHSPLKANPGSPASLCPAACIPPTPTPQSTPAAGRQAGGRTEEGGERNGSPSVCFSHGRANQLPAWWHVNQSPSTPTHPLPPSVRQGREEPGTHQLFPPLSLPPFFLSCLPSFTQP